MSSNRIIITYPQEFKNKIHSLYIFLEKMNYNTKKKFEISAILKNMKTQTNDSAEIELIDNYIKIIEKIKNNNVIVYDTLSNVKSQIENQEQPWKQTYNDLNKAGSLKILATKLKLSETKLPAQSTKLPAKSAPAKSAATPSTPAKLPAKLPATPAKLTATPAKLPATPATPATPAKLPATPATPAKLPAKSAVAVKSAAAVKSAPNSTPKKINSICDLITKY